VERISLWFKFLDTHNGLVTAFATAIVALFTVVLAIATIELKKLGEQQAEDMKASIAETKRSADAASTNAKVARDTLIHTQRSIIVIGNTYHVRVGDPLQGYSFWTQFKNAGPTTARQMRVATTLQWNPGRLPDDYDYSFAAPPEAFTGPSADIGRDGPVNSQYQGVTLDVLKDVQAAKKDFAL